MKKQSQWVGGVVVASLVLALGVAVMGLSGCATMDRGLFNEQVTWTNMPTVHVFTNTVVVTNTVPVVLERTNIVYVRDAAGAVAGRASVEPVVTNYVTAMVTNLVPVFMTNVVQVPVTNLVARPEAEATHRRRRSGGEYLRAWHR